MSTKRSIVRTMLRGRMDIPNRMIRDVAKKLRLKVVVTQRDRPWPKAPKLHSRQRRKAGVNG